MNESSCSSKFQSDVRKALPDCVLIKHRDKTMIGCLDASLTYNKKTLWLEYKFIGPQTKGVDAEFMQKGVWHPLKVASASPTQFAMAKRLAQAGHAVYLFWVLDHTAVRKKVDYVAMWNPITGDCFRFEVDEVVSTIVAVMQTR